MARGDKYEPLIQKYAKKYGVPAGLMREQIRSESNFDPRAVSSAGAAGIAQFMPKTGMQYGMKAIKKGNKWYATEDFFDPEKSIEAQAKYMSDIYNKQAGKDWGVTLAMYNMGPSKVKERGLESIFLPGGEHYEKETQGYVNRTLKRAGVKSPRIEAVLANENKDPIYNTPALLALKAERDKLTEDLKTGVQDYISTYEQDSAGAYQAQPDLDLMRELAQRAYQQDLESSMAESNLAAQLASLMNPAFAKQFQEQTSPRVNAARQYFANLGMINRQAMSASQATARAKRRSDARLQQLRQSIGNVDRLIAAERARAGKLEQIEKSGEQARETQRQKPQRAGGSGSPMNVNIERNRIQGEIDKLRKKIEGDADEQIMAKFGIDLFMREIMKEDSKVPEAQRLRKRYKGLIDLYTFQLDALNELSKTGMQFTNAQYEEMVKRLLAAQDEYNLQPQPVPGTNGIPASRGAGAGFLDRLRKKATGQ